MVGRGLRAQSPVVTTALPSKHKRKRGVESALGLAAPILLSHDPPCLWLRWVAPGSHLPGPRAVPCSSAAWVRVSLLGPTAARQRVSPSPPPLLPPQPADPRAATQDRAAQITQAGPPLWLCAWRSHSRPRRNTVTRGGAPGSPPAHSRAHAPKP